nr:structural maintenance of chromosomes protein 6A-like [Ziziphus jujuba var. spinosa]XP_048320277.1 structural maintenance of chromosomes protein 6A-like [Ziziphus jujuba var. spinosa]XP_048320278.1 structural maintenance of chromosomes protein 6A-like [Ziziphus jujuba var. spinosa]XP_048320279.1 structural maintenance of chromosomes protein 6A-like [Ziziphus jujuba var. spinosa]XP_048320280.1 structural maintenance of chromosomes protein 6A-like [Ziziphus jujuba var. spinosa]
MLQMVVKEEKKQNSASAMNDHISGVFHRPMAGVVKRIRLENFMCHSHLEIELGDSVNFITGQNGSKAPLSIFSMPRVYDIQNLLILPMVSIFSGGKSAILTALCIAFGCRAKGTQRASTLKDFIKTGCSYANVHVEIKNEGEDALKPEIYGDVIIIEHRISEIKL